MAALGLVLETEAWSAKHRRGGPLEPVPSSPLRKQVQGKPSQPSTQKPAPQPGMATSEPETLGRSQPESQCPHLQNNYGPRENPRKKCDFGS